MSARRKFPISLRTALPWLDTLALLAWGIVLVKLWLTGQLRLLIHPNYAPLSFGAGILLLGVGIAQLWRQWKSRRAVRPAPKMQHITLFPPGWATGLLLASAVAGLMIPPKILASDTAIQRGITESLPYTKTQTQAFRTSTKPEDRTIIDWVKTLNAYPEPDAYVGQQANVKGFVVRNPDLPQEYFLICRFVITCCAVDASPIGLLVKRPEGLKDYPNDTWLEVKGKTIAKEVGGQRQVVIKADAIAKIPTPRDPYEFN
ncbi:TIGR03943 family protein [Lusitaniella coriacea LEGE 07157]|uniref:TIGR03943 family protein n=1 Tax=Lusitaniella coriacea LEGE 07157 TaxID=945747 RepID=A0A8J7E2V6_9CYAN|nr:TIGR03943 family protein [Lusitaniella coriacea]MBE9118766.1 TIGR03943 family protein [Lusitaniella coriacea LEGE 07157]